jgi:PAS domain S-box-containing protein
MTDQTASDAATLHTIIGQDQDRLVERLLHHSRSQNYIRHLSLPVETQRQHVADLSAALLTHLEKDLPDEGLSPWEDTADDPLARFSIALADRYRSEGAALGIVLALMKIYRQSYVDLIDQKTPAPADHRRLSALLNRFFDRMEIGLCNHWRLSDDGARLKQVESVLQETRIWMTEMFNVLEEAVFIATPAGRIVDVNAAAQRIFGYKAAELKNRTIEWLHVDRAHFKSFTTRVRQALVLDGSTAFEYVGKRKNGEVFPVHVKITLLRKKDRKPLGIVCVVRDISTQKLAEEATRSSERLQGALELAGAVCHDLNQPLMAITGYAELILMDCPEDSPFTQKVNKIVRQAAKMGNITKKLMHVTRYETKAYLDKQIIDIEKASGRS